MGILGYGPEVAGLNYLPSVVKSAINNNPCLHFLNETGVHL